MSQFLDELNRRVILFDGAMGTSLHARDLDLQKDYLGKENCSEVLVLTRPDVIGEIHESYFAAGSDIVETNTFGANQLVLAEYGLSDQCREINQKAAEIARQAAEKFQSSGPKFVAGSIGPGTKLVTLGHTDWDTMFASYLDQARGLIDGGVDVLLIETSQDLLQIKCAVNACVMALNENNLTPGKLPIMAQVTIESSGTMLVGSDIAAAATALAPLPILSLGMNCATGPAEMAEHIRYLARHWPRLMSVQPNAGLPTLVDGRTEYPLAPEPFADALLQYVHDNGVNMVGGCCGTTPAHIAAVAKRLGRQAPVKVGKTISAGACSSLYGVTDYRQEASTLNIGERTNASGSRAFKKLLEAQDIDGIVSLAREQAREGSHVIDINVDYAGRDNAADMAQIVGEIVQQVNVPLMLDSTQADTVQAGLKCAAGKCIINSANLEEGEERFGQMLRLAKRYGAAIVLGTIDEDPQEAMARTADRKIAIARRLFQLATGKYGIDPRDIFFDPLVLPVSTGMEKDRRSALETIQGVRRIAQEYPQSQIVVGLSNVSFGLKPQARVVLNSAFLHELRQAGLTAAILHVSKILPQGKVPVEQWQAAMDLIYDRRERQGGTIVDPLQHFIDLFPDEQARQAETPADAWAGLSLEERLRRHIIDGERRGLMPALDDAMAKYPALAIVNDHLLEGMKTVGELFGSGQMQLPFVLQSAEVMKLAVAYLEPTIKQQTGGQASHKGSIVLATVKGDVHDIGKNLVDIILSNNGYTVHNLGIKQPIADIIRHWKNLKADAIGLSGLLVKSVAVMQENLHELNAQGIDVPVLLGGAALSRHYCENDLRSLYKGRVYYGRDAFEGLKVMDCLAGGRSSELDREIEERLAKRADVEAKLAGGRASVGSATATVCAGGASHATATLSAQGVDPDVAVPVAPFLGDRVVESIDLDDIYPFINTVALFRGQWQFKKGRRSDDQYQKQIDDQVIPLFEGLKAQAKAEGILQPKVVYGYFPANGDGDDLVIYDPADAGREIERFRFPRQENRQRLCISDYFKPVSSGVKDVIGLSCVTVGHRASQRTQALFQANQYQEYLYLHGLSVETAEALAEYWHWRMRQELGIAGDDSADVRELFTQHYRGSRYSFGYPACPDMSDQAKLFRLLKPERIGCALTDNWQIDPEQSTSAIIVHHPQAKYFSV